MATDVSVPVAPCCMLAVDGKLPEPTRTILLMALLGIALLGMLIVVVILLGGNWVRRIGSHRRGPSVPPDRESPPSREPRREHPGQPGETNVAAGDEERPPSDTVDDFGETHADRRLRE